MAEESWHEARLIPTSGINGPDEQERRATSALLAVMSAVRSSDAHSPSPSAPRRRGSRPTSKSRSRWATGSSSRMGSCERRSRAEVVDGARRGQDRNNVSSRRAARELPRHRPRAGLRRCAHDLQRDPGGCRSAPDAQSTSASCGRSRCTTCRGRRCCPRRSCRRSSAASPTRTRHGSSAELIRYLEHPRSGAMEFEDMGESWVPVRDAVGAGTLRASDKGVKEVAARFDALLRFACLNLGRQLGTEVTPVLSRKELAEPASRTQALVAELVSTGHLPGPSESPRRWAMCRDGRPAGGHGHLPHRHRRAA